MREVVEMGMDHIAHLTVRDAPGSDALRETIAFLKSHGTVIDPTISWNEMLGRSAQTPLASIQPGIEHVAPALRRMLETQLAHLAWNDLTRRAPVHTEILRELTEIGITQDLAEHLVRQLPEDTELTFARRFTIAGQRYQGTQTVYELAVLGTRLEATLKDGQLDGQYSRGTRGAPYPFQAKKFAPVAIPSEARSSSAFQ